MHTGLVVAKLFTVVLGLLIAVTDYRGHRRHGTRSMVYLAVGFAVISVGAVTEGLLFEVLGWDIFRAGMVQTGIVALGMVLVFHSLYGPGVGVRPADLRRGEDR